MWTDMHWLDCNICIQLGHVLAINSPVNLTFFSSCHECSLFLNTFPGCFYRFVWPGGSVENLVPGLHRLHQLLPAQVRVSFGGGHHSAHLPWPLPLTVHLLSGKDVRELTVRTAHMSFFLLNMTACSEISHISKTYKTLFIPFLSDLKFHAIHSRCTERL